MVLVEEHYYLPLEPVVSSFTFTRVHTEYVMRLEQWGPRPSLVFATRKWVTLHRTGYFAVLLYHARIACELAALATVTRSRPFAFDW
jgi:hypothetical protein